MAELIFTLPDGPCAPISGNDIPSHPMERTRVKNAFKDPTQLILQSQFNSQNMKALKPPVELYILYMFKDKPGSGRDRDNYTAGSTKWLIDVLKGFAWKGDDNTTDLDLRPVELIENTGETRTIIRVKEKR